MPANKKQKNRAYRSKAERTKAANKQRAIAFNKLMVGWAVPKKNEPPLQIQR